MALTMIFCTATSGVYCYLLSGLRIAHLIRKNLVDPNIYISNSSRKRDLLLLILIKINKRPILCVVNKFLFSTVRGDIDRSVFLLHQNRFLIHM